jgi:hypothetical protein
LARLTKIIPTKSLRNFAEVIEIDPTAEKRQDEEPAPVVEDAPKRHLAARTRQYLGALASLL